VPVVQWLQRSEPRAKGAKMADKKSYKPISKQDAVGKMGTAKGKIFTITFVKRSTGEVRTMNCRTGVSKDVKGVGLNYSRKQHNLFGVFDMQKQQHRSVNLDSLITLAIGGELYTIK